MESLDEPLLSEASRSLRAEALAEASLETHVEAGVVRLLASGAAAHAASALSRALAALPETHPMRVAAPPPGARRCLRPPSRSAPRRCSSRSRRD